MSEFQVYLHDPSTGRKAPEEELPKLLEIISPRRVELIKPNILTVVAEPMMPFLKRSHVGPVPIYPSAKGLRDAGNVEHNDCAIGTDCVAAGAALGYKIADSENPL